MKKRSLHFFTVLFFFSINTVIAQTQPPIANNDSATIMEPDSITVNVAANDSSTDGDSLCVTAVYGSSYFTIASCSSISFEPDSNFIGKDTCWYVICDDSFPTLCDTATLVVTVRPHYTPFMLENGKWVDCQYYLGCQNDGGPINSQQLLFYWTTTDTILLGKSYKKLYTNGQFIDTYCDGSVLQSGWVWGVDSNVLYGYLRQDTVAEKVFFLGVDSVQEIVLYNFNLNLGDTVYYNNPSDFVLVVSIDFFVSNGRSYRRFNFSNQAYGASLIEGIGPVAGLFTQYYFLSCFESCASLCCFSSGGQAIYPAGQTDTCAYIPVGIPEIKPNNTISIFPNPTNNTCTLQLTSTGENYTATILDITGREVMPLFNHQQFSSCTFNTGGLSSGLYFVRVSDGQGRGTVVKLVKE